jgi:beta-glucanase (GH16 family)
MNSKGKGNMPNSKSNIVIIVGFLLIWGCRHMTEESSWSLVFEEKFETYDDKFWEKGNHSFDQNAAYFLPENVTTNDDKLILSLERKPVHGKQFAGGELRTKRPSGLYQYGRFEVRMKAAKGSGVVSSFFTYRSDPWQEIDIEFLGKNTKEIHLNVWYNPGPEGAKNNKENQKPRILQLPFDASVDFHDYAIEWEPHAIRWYADGLLLAYEYTSEKAFPIPDIRQQIMVNLWVSESEKWAGEINNSLNSAQAEYERIAFYHR